MRRREFIALLGGMMVAWPARAQQSARVRRIGTLTGRAEDTESLGWVEAFKRRLGELGWNDGRNVRIELRADGDVEHWQTHAAEMVASAPDAIIVVGNPGVASLQRETRTIPIVFVLVGDPIGSGFVASLARPGGNVTGFMHFEPAGTGADQVRTDHQSWDRQSDRSRIAAIAARPRRRGDRVKSAALWRRHISESDAISDLIRPRSRQALSAHAMQN
jgi:hypothetical protein